MYALNTHQNNSDMLSLLKSEYTHIPRADAQSSAAQPAQKAAWGGSGRSPAAATQGRIMSREPHCAEPAFNCSAKNDENLLYDALLPHPI